jgi:ubiquitin-like protein Pup
MKEQKNKPTPKNTEDTEDTSIPAPKEFDAIDALLDEIDGVLEENAEEFVRGYVQKGGQ